MTLNLRVVCAIPTALRNSGGYTETAAESPCSGGGNSLTVTVRVAGTVAWPGRPADRQELFLNWREQKLAIGAIQT